MGRGMGIDQKIDFLNVMYQKLTLYRAGFSAF
jgi:hypothetical protein